MRGGRPPSGWRESGRSRGGESRRVLNFAFFLFFLFCNAAFTPPAPAPVYAVPAGSGCAAIHLLLLDGSPHVLVDGSAAWSRGRSPAGGGRNSAAVAPPALIEYLALRAAAQSGSDASITTSLATAVVAHLAAALGAVSTHYGARRRVRSLNGWCVHFFPEHAYT